jgi:hypothetical protein
MKTTTKTIALCTVALGLAASSLGCSGGTTIIIQQVMPDAGATDVVDAAVTSDATANTDLDAATTLDAQTLADASPDASVAPGDAALEAGPVDAGWTWDASQLLCSRYVNALHWQNDPAEIGRVIDTVSGLHWHEKKSAALSFNDAKAYCASKNSRLPTADEVSEVDRHFCINVWWGTPQAWESDARIPATLETGSAVGNTASVVPTLCVYN